MRYSGQVWLEVPAVDVIELLEVEVVAGHDADRTEGRDPCAQQKDIPDLDLAGKPAHETAPELVVVSPWLPRAGIPGADEANAVLQEDVHVRP
ncbi:hypothetical protein CSW50_13870 [Thermus scotoductus]|uniref:Uncharacterized protein n=1 Tax=Thermus scotoductus TaxID=37636 RepID=A0A430QVG3_THESC|nr:hypothetical protein CSW50_13870 [Thermus scotoductus]